MSAYDCCSDPWGNSPGYRLDPNYGYVCHGCGKQCTRRNEELQERLDAMEDDGDDGK